MVTYLGGSILITIFALSGSIVSYNLQVLYDILVRNSSHKGYFYAKLSLEKLIV